MAQQVKTVDEMMGEFRGALIREAQTVSSGGKPVLRLKLQKPDGEPFVMDVTPVASFQLNGNIMLCNLQLQYASHPVAAPA